MLLLSVALSLASQEAVRPAKLVSGCARPHFSRSSPTCDIGFAGKHHSAAQGLRVPCRIAYHELIPVTAGGVVVGITVGHHVADIGAALVIATDAHGLGRCRPMLNGAHGIFGTPDGDILLAEGNPSRITRLRLQPA
jgi:hypothetical protein